MKGPLKVRIGDRVEMRKPHPCGSSLWEVVALGMEVTIRCQGCGRRVRLLRAKFDRAVRTIWREEKTV